jgi:hypothetical protein
LGFVIGFSLAAVSGCVVACSSRVNGWTINPLMPNDHYSGRTALLTLKH